MRRRRGRSSISDDQIRESLEGAQLKIQRERGTDLTIFSPRACGMGHHIGNESTSKYWSRDLQRADPPGVHALSRTTSSASASCRRPRACARQLHRGAGALREGVRLHRLQPQSGSVRRLLDRPAAHRQVVVSAVREDGGARRAGDDPRQRVLQSELPCHRRALHQRRHHRVHAVHHRRTCSRISRR